MSDTTTEEARAKAHEMIIGIVFGDFRNSAAMEDRLTAALLTHARDLAAANAALREAGATCDALRAIAERVALRDDLEEAQRLLSAARGLPMPTMGYWATWFADVRAYLDPRRPRTEGKREAARTCDGVCEPFGACCSGCTPCCRCGEGLDPAVVAKTETPGGASGGGECKLCDYAVPWCRTPCDGCPDRGTWKARRALAFAPAATQSAPGGSTIRQGHATTEVKAKGASPIAETIEDATSSRAQGESPGRYPPQKGDVWRDTQREYVFNGEQHLRGQATSERGGFSCTWPSGARGMFWPHQFTDGTLTFVRSATPSTAAPPKCAGWCGSSPCVCPVPAPAQPSIESVRAEVLRG